MPMYEMTDRLIDHFTAWLNRDGPQGHIAVELYEHADGWYSVTTVEWGHAPVRVMRSRHLSEVRREFTRRVQSIESHVAALAMRRHV